MLRFIVLLLCLLPALLQPVSGQSKRKIRKKKAKASQTYLTHQKKKKKGIPDINIESFAGSSHPIEKIFYEQKEFYRPFLHESNKFRIQIIYTQIDRDERNVPTFTSFSFRLNPKEYFYPASTVKLPLCALALEKLNNANIQGLDRNTPLTIDSIASCQSRVTNDTSGLRQEASIGHYIRKILLVSDNDAYNRLFEFLGPEHIQQRMGELGMPNARITHRFIPCTDEENNLTNPFTFYKPNGEELYKQEGKANHKLFGSPYGEVLLGKGYFDFAQKYHREPKDFSLRNHFSLADIDRTLKTILFPEKFMANHRFQMAENDYRFMRRYLSMMPHESRLPLYGKPYFPCQKKYLYYGQSPDTMPDANLRIFNIVGFSYGFLTDAAYMVDFQSGAECIVSAVIYVNENDIFNDGQEEYYTLGMPFLKRLGQDIMSMERKRERKHRGNFDAFRFDYSGIE